MVKMEHVLEKRPGFTGAGTCQKKVPKNPLCHSWMKTVTGLFVHVIKKSPCVSGGTVPFMHSCVA